MKCLPLINFILAVSLFSGLKAQVPGFTGISLQNNSFVILDTSGLVSVNGNVIAKNTWNFGFNVHNAGTIRVSDTLLCETRKLFLTSTNALKDVPFTESNQNEYGNVEGASYDVSQLNPFGTVSFANSARNKAISGDSSVYFATLTTEGLTTLHKNISALKNTDVTNGNLLLNKHDIFLSDTVMDWFDFGQLSGEDQSGQHAVYDSLYYYPDTAGNVFLYKLVQNDSGFSNFGNIGLGMQGNLNYVKAERKHFPLTDVTNGGLHYHFKLKAFNYSSHEELPFGEPDSLNLFYRNTDLGTFEEDSLAVFTRHDGSASWEYLAG